MFEGGHRSRAKIAIPNRGYGVAIGPEPVYQYPEGHPCHGCFSTFQVNKPSCMSGSYPDAENCPNAFYRRIQARQKAEHGERLRQAGLE